MSSVERFTNIVLKNDSNRYLKLRVLYKFSSAYAGDTQWHTLIPGQSAPGTKVGYSTRGSKVSTGKFRVFGILYKVVEKASDNTITFDGKFLEFDELFLLPKLDGIDLKLGGADENQSIQVNVGNNDVFFDGHTDSTESTFVRVGNAF